MGGRKTATALYLIFSLIEVPSILVTISEQKVQRGRGGLEASGGKQAHENKINQSSKDTSENELLFKRLVFSWLYFYPAQTHLLLPIYISIYNYFSNVFIIHYTSSWVLLCHNLLFLCPSNPMSKHPCFHWALVPALEDFMIIGWILDSDAFGDIPTSSETKFKINFPSTPHLLIFPVVVAIMIASADCLSVRQWKGEKKEVCLNSLNSLDFGTPSSMTWTYEFEEPEEKLKKKQILQKLQKHQCVCTTSFCCEECKIQLKADLLLLNHKYKPTWA